MLPEITHAPFLVDSFLNYAQDVAVNWSAREGNEHLEIYLFPSITQWCSIPKFNQLVTLLL